MKVELLRRYRGALAAISGVLQGVSSSWSHIQIDSRWMGWVE